jgi:hypothetical protein
MIFPMFFVEPSQPLFNQLEGLVVCLIKTDASMALRANEPGVLEHAQVAGSRRPRMTETGSNLARRHFVATKMDGHEDLTPRRMGQGSEDCIELRETMFCLTLGH